MLPDVNIIVQNGNEKPNDADLFFQERVEFVSADTTLPQILKQCGFFSSTSQARKAGWPIEIPEGFNFWTIGKKKRGLFILNPKQEEAPTPGASSVSLSGLFRKLLSQFFSALFRSILN